MEDSKPTLYDLTYSQEVINLQSKYTLFKRVLNILFSISFDNGFDPEIMRKSIALLYKRNDCMRQRMIRVKGKPKLIFEPEVRPEKISTKAFKTNGAMEAFLKRFRRKALSLYRSERLKVIFVTDPSGKQMLLCKINHFVADAYGIGILIADLCGIYEALKNGTEMPPQPGCFEDIVRKDNEYRANEQQLQKDREFFNDFFYNRHKEAPVYCGLHGDKCDRYFKEKKKGQTAIPMLFLRCDATAHSYVMPASVTKQVEKWCQEKEIPMGTFLYFATSLTTSLINGKEQRPITSVELLNCRGTMADRKTAGTKAQGLTVVTKVDYNRSFEENARILYQEQTELYRHSRFPYLELNMMQMKAWKYSPIRTLFPFTFYFMPLVVPKGVSFKMYSNGKFALSAYIAMILNPETHELTVGYDAQDLILTPAILEEFQIRLVQVIEAVLAHGDETLNQVFHD